MAYGKTVYSKGWMGAMAAWMQKSAAVFVGNPFIHPSLHAIPSRELPRPRAARAHGRKLTKADTVPGYLVEKVDGRAATRRRRQMGRE